MDCLHGLFSVVFAFGITVGLGAAEVGRSDSGAVALRPDSVESSFHFPIGSSVFDISSGNNMAALDSIVGGIERFGAEGSEFSVDIIGLASPDGGFDRNMQLARQRAEASQEAIKSHSRYKDIRFTVRNGGINWRGLRSVVAESTLPAREEVVALLDEMLPDGTLPESAIKRLTTMQGGRVWRALNSDYFPDLRVALVSVYTPPRMQTPEGLIAVYGAPGQSDESPVADADTVSEEVEVAAVEEIYEPEPVVSPVSVEEPARDPLHRFALKTNLIYDALLMPNVELEWRINDRWSVAAEADVAWWKKDPRHKYYQILNLAAEGRYWFSTYSPWHGHYVGFSAGGGKFDLENGGTGYKGEGFLTGVSYGFMFPVSRCLSFDAEVGLGYLYANYSVYKPFDGHYLFQHKSRTNYFGPVKVKFSLVWRFNDISKKARK